MMFSFHSALLCNDSEWIVLINYIILRLYAMLRCAMIHYLYINMRVMDILVLAWMCFVVALRGWYNLMKFILYSALSGRLGCPVSLSEPFNMIQ